MCEELLEESAQCNVNLPFYGNGTDGEDTDEGTDEATTCNLIKAVQRGNIDKYGFVHLSKNKYFSDYINTVNNDYLPDGYFLSDGQFFGIVAACIVGTAFVIYSVGFKPQRSVETKELTANLV
jgi:hypothetical protein